MQKILILVGIPASGKSTFARGIVSKDPVMWVRINNDELRFMFNGSFYEKDQEKIVSETRNFIIKRALERGKNILIDNVNANNYHYKTVCDIAKSLNENIEVQEMPFYIDLAEAIERDNKREGIACVGKDIITKFWKQLGGERFKNYQPRKEIFLKNSVSPELKQNTTLPKCVIFDIDGTTANITNRSPYDTGRCLNDIPIKHIVELIKMYHHNDYQIIFCSGREEKFRDLTTQWLETHVMSKEFFKLYMRPTNDMRKDAIIKEEIYRNNIEGKYFVEVVFDDRNQTVNKFRELGLFCCQVARGDF